MTLTPEEVCKFTGSAAYVTNLYAIGCHIAGLCLLSHGEFEIGTKLLEIGSKVTDLALLLTSTDLFVRALSTNFGYPLWLHTNFKELLSAPYFHNALLSLTNELIARLFR